jgi:hypothetical protein
MTTLTAPSPAATARRRDMQWWAAVGVYVGVALYALIGAAYVARGRVNADEGWYLYASRLVYQGKLPFRDFSFTQMPLLPYVYGLPQVVGYSLRLGRVVSLAFALTGVVLCVRVAWREAGRFAALAVVVLCCAFPAGIYNLTLTKTYAMVACFLAVILFALTGKRERAGSWLLATTASMLLLLTRTSGFPVTLLVVGYVLLCAPSVRTRVIAAAITAVALVVAAAFVLVDPSAARFGLVEFHQLLWHHANTRTRIEEIFRQRIPDWAQDYFGYVALGIAALLAAASSRGLRRYLRENPVYVVLFVGIIGYLATQLPAGQWAPVEYATPVLPVAVTIAIVCVFRWAEARRTDDPAGAQWVGAALTTGIVGLAALTLIQPSARGYLVSDVNPGSITNADQVAAFVQDHTPKDGEVLALWGQPATVGAHRDLVPGATFGIFSYEDLSTPRAVALHYVNQQRLLQIVKSRRAAAIVLTDVDRTIFNFRGSLSRRRTDPALIPDAIDEGYRKVWSTQIWGTDSPVTLDVYLPRNHRR